MINVARGFEIITEGRRAVQPVKCKLTPDDIRQTFDGPSGDLYPPILSPRQLAHLLGLSPKTIYQWIAQGRLDGAFRHRGKHVLIWRDRAMDIIFNGKNWS